MIFKFTIKSIFYIMTIYSTLLSKIMSLPPIIFYEHHQEESVYRVLKKVIPILSSIGYKILLFEPFFLNNSVTEEKKTYNALPCLFFKSYFYSLGFNHVSLWDSATKYSMSIESNDLSREQFINVLHQFIDEYSFTEDPLASEDSIFITLKNNLKEIFHVNQIGFGESGIQLIRQVFSDFVNQNNFPDEFIEGMKNQFVTQMFEFFSTSGEYAHSELAKKFFSARNQKMADKVNEYTNQGVISIAGMSHQCHQMIPNSISYHITRFYPLK